MNRRLALWTAFAVDCSSRALAIAQQGQGEVTIGYQGLPYKASGETKTGIQVSDGVLHARRRGRRGRLRHATSSTRTSNPIGSPIYPHVAVRATLIQRDPDRRRRGAHLRRARRRHCTAATSPTIPALDSYQQRLDADRGPGAVSAGAGQIGFGLADTFARIEDPPYNSGAAGPIIRYNNQASVEGRWSPGGGRLTGTLRYTNMVDIFSTGGYGYATRTTNMFMLDASWKWLPKTAIFLNVQQGFVFYLNQAQAEPTPKVLVVSAARRRPGFAVSSPRRRRRSWRSAT